MIKIENVGVMGWGAAIRGMRNPLNSWAKSDSDYRPILCGRCDECEAFMKEEWEECDNCEVEKLTSKHDGFMIGPNDLDLIKRLCKAGTDHRKFMRMITVYLDITAPLYWWKEFDTYKIGTVANSCSTMHKIHAKEFTLEDFSCEHLLSSANDKKCVIEDIYDSYYEIDPTDILDRIIDMLNKCRILFLETKDKTYWWQMIQILPSSYNQKRTVMLNYEVLANMYHSRKNHKLDEWRTFCEFIETLPYSELITGKFQEEKESED